jgi:mannitol-1-/sugar-/sorbitol-6-phosphatase
LTRVPLTGQIEAVLFDFDGVLVDSTHTVQRAWDRWAERRRVDPLELRAIYHGRRTEEVTALVAPSLDPVEEAAWVENAMLTVDGGGVPIEGAISAYQRLPADRRAIVTSAMRPTARARVAGVGLSEPAALITADDVRRGKPHPDPYLLGAERLGRDPGRCLVVEDAPQGIEAGLAAGMTVVAVTTTHAAAELDRAHRIAGPAEIEGLLVPLSR